MLILPPNDPIDPRDLLSRIWNETFHSSFHSSANEEIRNDCITHDWSMGGGYRFKEVSTQPKKHQPRVGFLGKPRGRDASYEPGKVSSVTWRLDPLVRRDRTIGAHG